MAMLAINSSRRAEHISILLCPKIKSQVSLLGLNTLFRKLNLVVNVGNSKLVLSYNYANWDILQVQLRECDNEYSRNFMKILGTLRERDPSYHQLCRVVRQGEQPREGFLLLSNLVEDQMSGTSSYMDWILQIHRQTQS